MGGNERINKNEKLLGIIIDKNLDFNEYIGIVCLKAGRKVTVLGRISKNHISSFYTLTICILSNCVDVYDRNIEHKMNHLPIVYSDGNSTFKELLIKDGSITIQLNYLNIKGFSPTIMNEIFESKDNSGPELCSQTVYKLTKISYGENLL